MGSPGEDGKAAGWERPSVPGQLSTRLILGFRVVAWRSADQGTDERGEKLLASFADIVNKLEEPKIDREFFL